MKITIQYLIVFGKKKSNECQLNSLIHSHYSNFVVGVVAALHAAVINETESVIADESNDGELRVRQI